MFSMFLHMWSNWMAVNWVMMCFVDMFVNFMNRDDIVMVLFMCMDGRFRLWMECWRKSHWMIMMVVSSPFFFEDLSLLIMLNGMDEVWA